MSRDNTHFDLTGKVAIVTGGNGGLGIGMALGLALAGANVVVAGRDTAKPDQAVEQTQALGEDALGITMDVSPEAEVGR